MMLMKRKILTTCLFGVFALTGCVSTQTDKAVVPVVNSQQASVEVVLPRTEVSQVLASGYYSISERALTPVTVRDLGIEGIRGLATIDPEVSLEEEDGELELYYAGQLIKKVVEPLAHDSESWADATYDALQAFWPFSEDLAASNAERVYEAVFDAALSNLDIFSRYAGKKDASGNRDHREGFGGVDLTLRKVDERILVKSVGQGGPAARGGMKAGDMVIMVDDQPVIGKELSFVYDLLRGKVQTEVSVEIERPRTGVGQKLFLWRELVIEETVRSRFEDGILFSRISGFNERTDRALAEDIRDHILLHGDRFQAIVLDLRNNPGGLLKRAVRVADLFIAGGRLISTQGRHPDSFEAYEADMLDVSQGRPLVVLLNGKSASASEIVAAAIQDRKRGVVVGSSSYGKGTVQSVQRLPNDGEITITWSRLIAPSGYAFHGLGVRPSVCTSGVKQNKSRGPALWEVNGQGVRKSWQTVAIEDREGRKKLRNSCQPDQSMKGIDSEIARNIALDEGLYARFMGFHTIATVAP
jgi:carboxyl-terminal processing protease